jgi:hypothetical protein
MPEIFVNEKRGILIALKKCSLLRFQWRIPGEMMDQPSWYLRTGKNGIHENNPGMGAIQSELPEKWISSTYPGYISPASGTARTISAFPPGPVHMM